MGVLTFGLSDLLIGTERALTRVAEAYPPQARKITGSKLRAT